jgi:transposase Tn5 family protein
MRGQKQVLLVQDTTSFDFSQHRASEGMGPLANGTGRGFFSHSSLAVSVEGIPLGLMDQQVWVRSEAISGQRHQRHERALEVKESYKWIVGLQASAEAETATEFVTVCDREADIYDFFDAALRANIAFVVRARQERVLASERRRLTEVVEAMPVQATFRLEIGSTPQREGRQAQMELRFGQVSVKRPRRSSAEQEALTVGVIDVREIEPPLGETAIHWLLLTSLPLETAEQAQTYVRWYSFRWLIERFHYVLKSGCKLEERQLREEKRLERLLAVFSLVAWHLLWLTYQARLTPDVPCTVALKTQEWQALYAFIQRNPRLPTTVPTLHQALRWIAQLGGFLGRKGDGEPGVKVLWRGWLRLQDITDTWLLFHPSPRNVGNV